MAETQDGQQRLEQLVSATSQHHVSELAELEALATGSGVSYQDLLLANLRGDIGFPMALAAPTWPGAGQERSSRIMRTAPRPYGII